MSDRITVKHLEGLCNTINRVTDSPAEPYTRDESGFHANIGNYHLSGAYSGYSLHRMVTDGGGVSDVFSCGHQPKRELYNRMRAFLDGIEATRRV